MMKTMIKWIFSAGVMLATGAAVCAPAESPAKLSPRPATPSAAASSSPGDSDVSDRSAYYYLTFQNRGPAGITLSKQMKDWCWYESGPTTIYVSPYSAQQITLEDNNNVKGCSDIPKEIGWSVSTNYGTNQSTSYTILFSHFNSGGWATIIDTVPGYSTGHGLVTSATCDGHNCLILPYYSGDKHMSVEIAFDGSYNGPGNKAAIITFPAQHSAVHYDSPFYGSISGAGTPYDQLSVTAKGKTETPIVASDGTWRTDAVYHFDPNAVYSATASGPAGGSTSTFISIYPLVLATPADGATLPGPEVTVSGTGNPGANVTVAADDHQDNSPSCSATVNGDGNWTCTLTAMKVGKTYDLVALQYGVAGSDGWPWRDTPVSRRIEMALLPVAITSPANGSHVDGDNPQYHAVAGTGTPGATITIDSPYALMRKPITTTVDDNGNWKTDDVFDFPPAGQPYQLGASQAYEGQHSQSPSVSFSSWESAKIVEPVPPQGRKRKWYSSDTREIVIQGRGQQNATLYPGLAPADLGSLCSPPKISASDDWSCRVGVLRSGVAEFTAYQASGSQQDPPVTLEIGVVTPVTIQEPVQDQIYPVETSTIIMKGSGQPGASLTVLVGKATACPSQIIGSSGNWSCAISGLEPGWQYEAAALQVDVDGDWRDPAVIRRFSVQDWAPLIITSPTDNSVISPTSSVTVIGKAEAGAEVDIDVVPNVPGCSSTQANQAGDWSCDLSGLSWGVAYVVSARQSYHGRVSEPVLSHFTVARALIIDLPHEGQVFGALTQQIVLQGSGQPGAQLTHALSPDYQELPCDQPVQTDGSWKCAVKDLQENTSYQVRVKQSTGTWQDAPVSRGFSVAAPEAVTISNPSDGAWLSRSNPADGISISGTGQSQAEIRIYINGTKAADVNVPDNGIWATNRIQIGQYVDASTRATDRISIEAQEYMEGQKVSDQTIWVNPAAPATISQPVMDSTVQDVATVQVGGAGQDGATVIVSEVLGDNVRQGCRAVVGGQRWQCALTVQPATQYSIQATQSGAQPDFPNSWEDLPVQSRFTTRTLKDVIISSPSADNSVSTAAPYDIAGTGEPGASVELRFGGFKKLELGPIIVGTDGSWRVRAAIQSGPGCYRLTATQFWNDEPTPHPADVVYAVTGPDDSFNCSQLSRQGGAQ